MRVLYDHQIFESQAFGGISRYHAALADNLEALGIEVNFSVKYSENRFLVNRDDVTILGPPENYNNWMGGREFKGKWRLYKLFKREPSRTTVINRQYSVDLLRSGEFDIFHPTDMQDPYFIEHIGDIPLVVTVHDTIPEIYADAYGPEMHNLLSARKEIIKRADVLISVSKYTAENIARYFPEESGKVKVIYHGLSFPLADSQQEKIDQLLYVGARTGYKNFESMLTQIAKFLKEHNFRLICFGLPFSKNEKRLIRLLGLSDLVRVDSGSDQQLTEYYRQSVAFLYPSIEEGFGMPVLEAMSQACPVVASDKASIPEVGGDAAVYFDPLKPDSLESKLLELLDPEVRKTWITKGLERCQLFDWKKTATETAEVYRGLKVK